MVEATLEDRSSTPRPRAASARFAMASMKADGLDTGAHGETCGTSLPKPSRAAHRGLYAYKSPSMANDYEPAPNRWCVTWFETASDLPATFPAMHCALGNASRYLSDVYRVLWHTIPTRRLTSGSTTYSWLAHFAPVDRASLKSGGRLDSRNSQLSRRSDAARRR